MRTIICDHLSFACRNPRLLIGNSWVSGLRMRQHACSVGTTQIVPK